MCKRVFSVYVGMVGVSVVFLEGLRVIGEEREKERNVDMREKHRSVASPTLHGTTTWTCALSRFEPATFHSVGPSPTN